MRSLIALFSAGLFVLGLAAASHVAASPGAGARCECPSAFDYLVLASITYSPQPFALAGYRSGEKPH